MSKITDKIAALPYDATYHSLEFFPPKTQTVLYLRPYLLYRLLQPADAPRAHVDCAAAVIRHSDLGAGGCTSTRSFELAEICQRQLGLTTCLHLTCTNMKRRLVDQALEEAKVLGVRNILALRGDPPREEEYRLGNERDEETDSNEEFAWAADLVRYIRRKHGDYFCIGVAAYPEGHSDLSHPTDQDPAKDLPYLVDKVKAGADFIMTQLFYDVHSYIRYEKLLRVHESGVFKTMPIIPGLMPIQSFEILSRTTKLSHAKLPEDLHQKLLPVKGDDEAVKRVGLDAISDMVEQIKTVQMTGPRGFHFYTLNLEKAVTEILDRCQLIPQDSDCAVSDLPPMINGPNDHDDGHNRTFSSSSTTAAAQLTTNVHRPSSPMRLVLPSTNQNGNQLSREATWDDFINGRFGDARSPAFNPPLTYSPTSNPAQKFLDNRFSARNRRPALFRPNPRLGAPGGFVFQKAFVEAFVPSITFSSTLRSRLQQLASDGEISWYAVTSSNDFETSEPASAVHAVTWGSFKGKEIATATMVEEVSFRAWGEEAFGIWSEWGRCVGEVGRGLKPGDELKEKLRGCREFLLGLPRRLVLVNVIGHRYMNAERLWEVLMK
ncbi:uncharacterized protein KY384_005263 [Bacidia gigantensis]|uniref:uncharacterized protein n=1 Tax=Bacidia gigantensis TaxID=2732470 RepID=UPI001D03F428|nr:uncharacterized protein KY384_005263 [Bacidia gigantensis]KAG8529782.1 hypothetical protein KY384_005263 [Bacidia gigantensis]